MWTFLIFSFKMDFFFRSEASGATITPQMLIWNIFDYFGKIGLFWTILDCFGLFWIILEKIGLFWKKFGIFWKKLEYFRIFWNILEYFGIF